MNRSGVRFSSLAPFFNAGAVCLYFVLPAFQIQDIISRKENMFKKIKNAWRHHKLDRDFRRKGIVGKARKVEDSAIAAAADKSRILALFLLFLLWAVAALILIFPCKVSVHQKLTKGEKAPKSIFAERGFSYISAIATLEKRKEAAKNIPDYYVIDDRNSEDIKNRFHAFFQEITKRFAIERRKKEVNAAERAKLRYIPSDDVPFSREVANLKQEDFVIFSNLFADDAVWNDFSKERDRLISSGIFSADEKNKKSVGKKIVIVDLAGRQHSPKTVDDIPTVEKASQILSEKISGKLSTQKTFAAIFGSAGNLKYDNSTSNAAAIEAVNAIPDVTIEVKQYTPVITKNSVINDALLEKYDAYLKQQQQQQLDIVTVLRCVFTSLIMVVFVGFYMYHVHPEVLKSNRRIALLGFVTIFSLLLNYGAIKLYMFGGEMFNLPQQYMLYFSPYTLASVILAVILGFRVALYIGFFVTSLLAIMNGGGFEFAFIGMVACSLSALAVRDAVNYRAFFFWTLLPVWFIGFICFLPNIEIARWSETLITGMIIAFTNGFLTSISALMIVFFLELVFNVTTNMSLLLLADNHPLLERLKREAPGTYFHSMMVATLAEDAAKAIGANAVRAKCGALYHDIGKLSKPQYFTENNLENHNQHTDLNPQVSSIIIRDHVKEGLVLARKYKLNRVIRNAIEQHHGNDLVHYFYNRAMLDTKNGSHVDEGQFRYQGDLPQDKEMVIISLADACEAAVRSLEKPSVQKIEMMVDEIFKKRFRDNQLNQAQITLSELHKVRESFVTNLISMRHGRIAYHKDENNGNEDENDLFMAAAKEHSQSEPKKTEEIY